MNRNWLLRAWTLRRFAGSWSVFGGSTPAPRTNVSIFERFSKIILLEPKHPADDVKTATERLHADNHFAVILLGMKLPDGDGTEVFHQARQANPQTQVVVITGYLVELEQRVRQVLAEGARAVLHKPFDVPDLLRTVGRLTARTGE